MVVIARDRGEIVHGQPVVRSDEVHRAARRFGEEVGAALNPLHDRGDLARLAADEAAHLVAIPVVPLQPRWRPLAELVLRQVPRLGDQTNAAARSPFGDLLDQHSAVAGQQRREIEAETVDPEVGESVERREDQPTDVGVGRVRDVARPAVVVVRAVRSMQVRVGVVEAAQRERGLGHLTFARVVEHHVEPDLHLVPVRGGHELGELLGRVVSVRVRPVDRPPDDRHVAPVVVGVVERVHGHQLDDVDAQIGDVRQALGASVERRAEPPNVHFVDDRIGMMAAQGRLLRPGRAHHRKRAIGCPQDVHRVRIEQRPDTVDREPVHVSVDRVDVGHPRRAVLGPGQRRLRHFSRVGLSHMDRDVPGIGGMYDEVVRHVLSMASPLACDAMPPTPTVSPASPADVSQALSLHGYLPDDGLATAVFLALALKRPLLLEGEAGVGKTEVAKVLSRWTGGELIRLQCYEGINAAQAVYDWDYSRQLLHLRAAEASGEARGVGTGALEEQLYNERFLLKRALLQAIDHRGAIPPVLLIDEIDRADDEFEAYLLEMLSDYQITIPELGKFTTTRPPIVVLTSNRTRDVHDALKRRCLYHWVEHPDFEREVKIVRMRVPNVIEPLARQVAAAVEVMRGLNMYKPPGVAETIDWAQALAALGVTELDEATVESTLGTVLKYREDQERARQQGIAGMVKQAFERSTQQP